MAATNPRVRQDVAVVELDGEAVIYDQRHNEFHHLNPAATLIYRLCDGTATITELAANVAEAAQRPAREVEGELRALLRELREAQLLEDAPPAPRRKRTAVNG